MKYAIKFLTTTLFSVSLLALVGCASNDTASSNAGSIDESVVMASSAKEASDGDSQLVCKYIKPTGSRIGERTCATQERWDKAEQEAKSKLSEVHRQSTMTNPDGA